MTVHGNLSDISLPLLIQLTCGRGQTASLKLHRQRLEQGVISFAQGEIVHAESGEMLGEAAVYELLGWQEGRFRLEQATELPQRRTVYNSWKQLLAEGKRQVKSRQLANGVPPPGLSLEDLPPLDNLSPADRDQENAFIHLLSVLEHLRSELEQTDTLQRPVNVLAILLNMVNRTIDWYGKLRPDPAEKSILPRIMGQVVETNPAVRLFGMEQGRLQANLMQALFKNWPGSSLSRERLLQDLYRCLLDILEGYLNALLQQFDSQSLAQQWRLTFRTFLLEIESILGRVRW